MPSWASHITQYPNYTLKGMCSFTCYSPCPSLLVFKHLILKYEDNGLTRLSPKNPEKKPQKNAAIFSLLMNSGAMMLFEFLCPWKKLARAKQALL